ncbi:uncharacterized protein LOC133858752 [Alnus glutinosa]|uniref:uncharacterized protein LOC133858752 n=1 Tax=Alnus glutinosa TaxID=3517 RepID=UPI002D78757C|nr:uncharacterized protein LOC133858752 [Alnus glutinosa]
MLMERSGHEMKKKKKMGLRPRGIFEVLCILEYSKQPPSFGLHFGEKSSCTLQSFRWKSIFKPNTKQPNETSRRPSMLEKILNNSVDTLVKTTSNCPDSRQLHPDSIQFLRRL